MIHVRSDSREEAEERERVVLLVYIVMAMKLDPTLGAEIPLDGWTNSVRSMKNESLLPPAFAG